MTEPAQPVRKLSISVPPDVAARLDREDNVSAFITNTVRARVRAEEMTAILRDRGMVPTSDGVARAAARRATVEAEWPAERYAQVRERVRREIEAERQADERGQQAAAA